jgi:hypothetical protein
MGSASILLALAGMLPASYFTLELPRWRLNTYSLKRLGSFLVHAV